MNSMRLFQWKEYDYFCIFCSRERKVRLNTDDPPAFLKGEKCENCKRGKFAYSPPANRFESDL